MSSSRNFLLRYAPDCPISSRKMKKFPTVGGRHPLPPSHILPRSVATLPRKDCAPKCFVSLRALLQNVSCFSILGPILVRISWNVSGSILMKFLKLFTSSPTSSAINFSYWPYIGRLRSQGLTHTLLLFLLLAVFSPSFISCCCCKIRASERRSFIFMVSRSRSTFCRFSDVFAILGSEIKSL